MSSLAGVAVPIRDLIELLLGNLANGEKRTLNDRPPDLKLTDLIGQMRGPSSRSRRSAVVRPQGLKVTPQPVDLPQLAHGGPDLIADLGDSRNSEWRFPASACCGSSLAIAERVEAPSGFSDAVKFGESPSLLLRGDNFRREREFELIVLAERPCVDTSRTQVARECAQAVKSQNALWLHQFDVTKQSG